MFIDLDLDFINFQFYFYLTLMSKCANFLALGEVGIALRIYRSKHLKMDEP